MTTHVQGPGDSSTAKLTLIGSIATALIAAVGAIIINHDDSTVATQPLSATKNAAIAAEPAIFKPPLSQESDDGSWDNLQYEADSVSVSGSANEYVQVVFIAIGPNSSNKYWARKADVVNQRWQADIPTGQPSKNYPISVSYWPSRDATPVAPVLPNAPSAVPVVAPAGRLVSENHKSQSVFQVNFEATPTPLPTPAPDELANCVVEHGPSCLTGPGFGPPSVYQPKQ